MLCIFATTLKTYLGHFKFLVFYLLCGFAATFTYILLNLTLTGAKCRRKAERSLE